MAGGLTTGEELDLAIEEIGRQRAALDIAMRGLAAARDGGFPDANRFMAEANEALAGKLPPPVPLLPSQFRAWIKGLLGR